MTLQQERNRRSTRNVQHVVVTDNALIDNSSVGGDDNEEKLPSPRSDYADDKKNNSPPVSVSGADVKTPFVHAKSNRVVIELEAFSSASTSSVLSNKKKTDDHQLAKLQSDITSMKQELSVVTQKVDLLVNRLVEMASR